MAFTGQVFKINKADRMLVFAIKFLAGRLQQTTKNGFARMQDKLVQMKTEIHSLISGLQTRW